MDKWVRYKWGLSICGMGYDVGTTNTNPGWDHHLQPWKLVWYVSYFSSTSSFCRLLRFEFLHQIPYLSHTNIPYNVRSSPLLYLQDFSNTPFWLCDLVFPALYAICMKIIYTNTSILPFGEQTVKIIHKSFLIGNLHVVVFLMLCSGEPARTVGWRDPGFIHTSFLKDLWPNKEYEYNPFTIEIYSVYYLLVLLIYYQIAY